MHFVSVRFRRLAFAVLFSPSLFAAQTLQRLQNVLPMQGDRLLSFSVPGSAATFPLGINETGAVTGYYLDSAQKTHGFVRDSGGNITTFDVPGSVFTMATSINTAGDITGYYEATAGVPLGFLRDGNGNFTTFGNPASPFNSTSQWAQPVALNVAGAVAGNFPNATLSSEAFVRTQTGEVQTFTLSLGQAYPTVVTALNAGGAVVGYYSSQGLNVAQGFYWSGQGPVPNFAGGFTPITFPGSTATFPTAMNAEGAIAGCYNAGGTFYDFIRAADGTFATVQVPGAVAACLENGSNGIFNVSPSTVLLNDEGELAGSITANNTTVAFVRAASGQITQFAFPQSKATIATGLNNGGQVTGYYTDGSQIAGFLRIPRAVISEYGALER